MDTLQIHLLGDFQITLNNVPVQGFEAPRLQSLLAYLLLHRDAPQSRKHIAYLLWQDSPEAQAHSNLRYHIHRLRKALPEADRFLVSDAQTLRWRDDAPFTLDADEFRRLLAAAEQTTVSENAAALLQSAVGLYRGDLLPACHDEWLLPEREILREHFTGALTRLVELHQAAREYTNAIPYAQRLLQSEPLSEAPYRTLMTLYARVGDRANVVRVYQTCAAVMQRDLDTEPSATTRALFEQLRQAETRAEPPPAPRAGAKHNLPAPLTSFVGRTRELAQVQALLERTRLVTLLGMGGCGKTRLAVELAHTRLNDYADGVWFIDLASLTDGAGVAQVAASVFGLREQLHVTPRAMVMDYARAKELLVVLDNCEHVRAAAAEFAHELVQAAPRVRILATSREPLNLAGEALLVVPPLSLPDPKDATPEALSHSDAAQLFRERAEFILPTFALTQKNAADIAQICWRLDGIPLAIELAAARVRTLTPAQIAQRLDDTLSVLTRGSAGLPTRHQTMRAVLDWSDALLSDAERVLFRRLAVFAGGFMLEAVEQICSEVFRSDDTRDDHALVASRVLDWLSNLIDKSLVSVREMETEMRYRLLEPIREYAREQLEAHGETEFIAARHLDYFMHLAEQAERELTGSRQGEWIQRLDKEHDNFRAALSWNTAQAAQQTQQLQLASAFWRFWYVRGKSSEGQAFLERVLERGQNAPAAVRAKAYSGLGTLVWLRGDYRQCIHWHEQALHLYRASENEYGIALALSHIGGAYISLSDFEKAVLWIEPSLTLARRIQDHYLLATILTIAAELARYQGAYDKANELNSEALAIAAENRNLLQMALSLNNLGFVATRQNDFARALELHRKGLQIYREVWEVRFVPEALEGLAFAQNSLGNAAQAAVLLGASAAIRAAIDLSFMPPERAEYERVLSNVQANLQDDFQPCWAKGQSMTVEQAFALALAESG